MHELKCFVVAVIFTVCGVLPAIAQHHHPPPPAKPAAEKPKPSQPPQTADQHQKHQPPAEHAQEHVMTGALGISRARSGSGTAWLPDATPMRALHGQFGNWMGMFHENAFIQYISEGTDRGDDDFGSVNWIMGMAERRLRGGHLSVRAMFSLEPLSLGDCGYPDLLATGEFCDGRPLHDRQHPHDLLMEAAALYEREITPRVAVQAYAALAGEPALGPVAFPHRTSALSTPLAPLTHHWLDSTHISYGVFTGGLFGRRWKAEASIFNGREPDENRYDVDFGALDSFAGRLALMPTERWSLQVSRGHLNEAEVPPDGGPRRDVDRTTASAIYHHPFGSGRLWTNTVAWGRNAEEDHATNAWLFETDFGLDTRNTLFARAEVAEKTGEELVVPELEHDAVTVSKLHVGYMRALQVGTMFEPTVGAALSFSAIPARLERAYGRGSGVGIVLFLNLRPRLMDMGMGMTGTPATPLEERLKGMFADR